MSHVTSRVWFSINSILRVFLSDSTTSGLKKPLGKFSSLLFHFVSTFLSEFKESLKCDLNPVFRRKGALLWPPLHPSPHFHPLCLGPRMKLLKRLSTSSFSPHRVGNSKSTWSPWLYLPLPFAHLALSSLLYAAPYLPLLLHEPPVHQVPSPSASSSAKRVELWGFCKDESSACLTAQVWAESWAYDAALANFNTSFLCSRHLRGRWQGNRAQIVWFFFFLKQPPVWEEGADLLTNACTVSFQTACFHFCYTQPNILHLLVKVKTRKTKSCKYE